MVGITAIFAFLGIAIGLVGGLWWGFSQSWFAGITASMGGAVAGGVVGCIAGFLGEEVPEWIRKFSARHRVSGSILFWTFWLLWFMALGVLWYGGVLFIRHMRHHV